MSTNWRENLILLIFENKINAKSIFHSISFGEINIYAIYFAEQGNAKQTWHSWDLYMLPEACKKARFLFDFVCKSGPNKVTG